MTHCHPLLVFHSICSLHFWFSSLLLLQPPFFYASLASLLPLYRIHFLLLFISLRYHLCPILQWLYSCSCPHRALHVFCFFMSCFFFPVLYCLITLFFLCSCLFTYASPPPSSSPSSPMITTHSFNWLPLQSDEGEVMGVFCLKLSAQLLNSENKQYLSCLAFSLVLTRVLWGRRSPNVRWQVSPLQCLFQHSRLF